MPTLQLKSPTRTDSTISLRTARARSLPQYPPFLRSRTRIRADSAIFGSPDRQHWTRRRPHDAFGDTSEKQTVEGPSAVCPHDYQVDVRCPRVGDDIVSRVVGRFNDGAGTEHAPIVVGKTVEETEDRCHLQALRVRRRRLQE